MALVVADIKRHLCCKHVSSAQSVVPGTTPLIQQHEAKREAPHDWVSRGSFWRMFLQGSAANGIQMSKRVFNSHRG